MYKIIGRLSANLLKSIRWLLLLLVLTSHSSLAVDETQFPLHSFAEFEKVHPIINRKGFQIDTEAHGFSTEVSFTGKARKLSIKKIKFLEELKTSWPGNQEMFSLYEDEIEVREKGKSLWIPAQKQLLAIMKKELRAGQSVLLFVRYFGSIDSEQIYLMIHYSHSNGNPPKKRKGPETII